MMGWGNQGYGLGGMMLIHRASPGMAPFSGWGGGGFYDKGSYASNGERIYYLGIDSDGKRLKIRGGPHWLYAMGGSCVNCHGPDGRGGMPVMMGTHIPGDICIRPSYQAGTTRGRKSGNLTLTRPLSGQYGLASNHRAKTWIGPCHGGMSLTRI